MLGFATLLAEDGREMHKSWGNSIEFNEAANTMGADVMRWLYLDHKPEQNLLFGYNKGDETRRRFLIPLWNVYSFFVTYANLDQWVPRLRTAETVDESDVDTNSLLTGVASDVDANRQLDRWIVERLNETTLAATRHLESFASDRATDALEEFLDDLSNWYVRRSRRRFWASEQSADKEAAYTTLYHVLVTFTKLLAPFIPFTAEAIYQNLVRSIDPNALESVHHSAWPEADEAALDRDLLARMRLAVTVAGLGRSARSAADIKLRQPLAQARVNVGSEQERQDILNLADVLAEEINVKEIEVVSEVGELVDYKLLPNNRLLGPKYGADFPRVRQALSELDPGPAVAELQETGSLTITLDDESLTLDREEVLVQTESRGGLAVASDRGVTVAVDVDLTPELVREGYARDLVRTVNTMRKEAGLEIEDRINLYYREPADEEVAAALRDYADYIREETLARALVQGLPEDARHQETVAIGDAEIVLALDKVE